MTYRSIQSRLQIIKEFYSLLDGLTQNPCCLRDLPREMPNRGVYFFMEIGQERSDSGAGLRVVRVGTHALKAGSRSRLQGRLNQHRGAMNGNGNHRGSIFRKLVGEALIEKNGYSAYPEWGRGSNAHREVKESERLLEHEVSLLLGEMRVLWLPIEDEPGPDSMRGYIERNAIALLSNRGKEPIDSPGTDWLGYCSRSQLVRESGLWNQNHVGDAYDEGFLVRLRELVEKHLKGKDML